MATVTYSATPSPSSTASGTPSATPSSSWLPLESGALVKVWKSSAWTWFCVKRYTGAAWVDTIVTIN